MFENIMFFALVNDSSPEVRVKYMLRFIVTHSNIYTSFSVRVLNFRNNVDKASWGTTKKNRLELDLS